LRHEPGIRVLAVVEFREVPAIIVTVLRRSPAALRWRTATVHVSADDLQLTASYEPVGDVLYLSAPGDDKRSSAQETPEVTPCVSIARGG